MRRLRDSHFGYVPDAEEEDRRARTLDTASRKFVSTNGHVRAMAFTADSSVLIAGEDSSFVQEDRVLTLYDVAGGGKLASLAVPETVTALDVSADMIAFATANRQITFADVLTGGYVRQLDHTCIAHSMRFTGDGGLLAIGGENGTVSLRNPTASGRDEFDFDLGSSGGSSSGPVAAERTKSGSSSVSCLAFTPGGRYLCTGLCPLAMDRSSAGSPGRHRPPSPSFEGALEGPTSSGASGRLTIIDISSGAVLWETSMAGGVRALTVSSEGDRIACAASGRLSFHTLHLQNSVQSSEPGGGLRSSGSMSGSGQRRALTSGVRSGEATGKILWEVPHSVERPQDEPRALVLSPDGKQVISAGGKMVVLRVARTGEVLRELRHSYPITCLVISPDGSTLAYGGEETRISVRQLRIAELTRTIVHGSASRIASLSSDGGLLALADGPSPSFTPLVARRAHSPPASLSPHPGTVSTIGFSQDGSLFASASNVFA